MKTTFSLSLCMFILALDTPHNQAMNYSSASTALAKKIITNPIVLITLGAIGGATIYYLSTKKSVKNRSTYYEEPEILKKEESSVNTHEAENLYKKIPYVPNVKVFGGYNKYEEYIDIIQQCSITQTSFKELIEAASQQKKSFILAVAKTKESDNETPFQHSYFDAPSLYRWMFEETTFKRKTTLKPDLQHPTFKKEILIPLKFYAIDSLTDDFRYVGDETLLTHNYEGSLWLQFNLISGLEDGNALNNYGVTCYNNSSITYAEHAWKLASEKYDNMYATHNLGILYQRKKNNLEAAEKYYVLAIEKHSYAISMYELGTLYLNQNKLDLAEKWLLSAMENNYAPAVNNLGMTYLNQNKLDEAKKLFLKAYIEQNNIISLYNLGIVHIRQGNKKQAREYWQIAFENGHEMARIAILRLDAGNF